jgi:hypothetical protein
MGVRTVGDIAHMPEDLLLRHFGQNGRDMALHARGIDDRPVVVEHAARSVSQEVTFDRDIASGSQLQQTLRDLSQGVARTLRQKGLCAGTVRLKLRWPDFTTLSRQVSIDQPTDQDGVIYEAVLGLFHSVWSEGRPVRLIRKSAACWMRWIPCVIATAVISSSMAGRFSVPRRNHPTMENEMQMRLLRRRSQKCSGFSLAIFGLPGV